MQFALRCDLNEEGSNFWFLILYTEDVEVRSAYVRRRLEQGKECTAYLLRGASRELWEAGLRAAFKSEYLYAVNEFLGPEIGTIDRTMMRDLRAYRQMEDSALREIECGQLPVNYSWDEFLILGRALNKEAAGQVIDEAISIGMDPDNPRLSMLKLNLQL